MPSHPDLLKVSRPPEFAFEDNDERDRVFAMLAAARSYIEEFGWCASVHAQFIGLAVGDVVGVVLFHVLPSDDRADPWVWVINGDIPSSYITVDKARNSAQALDGYIGAVQEWIEHVLSGRSTADLIPIDLPADAVHARELAKRIDFIDRQILRLYASDL